MDLLTEIAGSVVIRAHFLERGFNRAFLESVRASGSETASGGNLDCVGDFPFYLDSSMSGSRVCTWKS